MSHRRGPWSAAEDARLLQLINSQGPTNWVRISQLLGTRTAKQCRERYHQNLKPSLNHSPISAEEGVLIESLVAQLGKKWAEIARHLAGRSDNAVKNWWNGGANRRKRSGSAGPGEDGSVSPPMTATTRRRSSQSSQLPDQLKLPLPSPYYMPPSTISPPPPLIPDSSDDKLTSASTSSSEDDEYFRSAHYVPPPPRQPTTTFPVYALHQQQQQLFGAALPRQYQHGTPYGNIVPHSVELQYKASLSGLIESPRPPESQKHLSAILSSPYGVPAPAVTYTYGGGSGPADEDLAAEAEEQRLRDQRMNINSLIM
ncbi:Homeodomain-like protein [Lipomyces kononenkoae]|uniref:Homeodomain-like protein n=1 Tax=Lipomyces kononenkoae TaxID=34357 RepID=A0ACC3T4Y7_LIPKO